jgi:DNA-binding CsgD family transcriptional regulator
VDFLSEQREGFGAELEEIRLRRDADYASEARGRMSEREREIERLILEEGGSYYIIDLLHFLKEKGFRMTKRDLTEFIDARQGPHWDEVRKRIAKMQLKEKDKINNYLTKR